MAAVNRLSDRMPELDFRLRFFHHPLANTQAIDKRDKAIAKVNFAREFVPSLGEREKIRPVVQRVSVLSDLDAMQRISPTFVGGMW